jgi:hypothetical protein
MNLPHFKALYTIHITPEIISLLVEITNSQFQQLISDSSKTKTTNGEFASKYMNLFGIPEVDEPKFSYYLSNISIILFLSTVMTYQYLDFIRSHQNSLINSLEENNFPIILNEIPLEEN